jgi:hypothetical protein
MGGPAPAIQSGPPSPRFVFSDLTAARKPAPDASRISGGAGRARLACGKPWRSLHSGGRGLPAPFHLRGGVDINSGRFAPVWSEAGVFPAAAPTQRIPPQASRQSVRLTGNGGLKSARKGTERERGRRYWVREQEICGQLAARSSGLSATLQLPNGLAHPGNHRPGMREYTDPRPTSGEAEEGWRHSNEPWARRERGRKGEEIAAGRGMRPTNLRVPPLSDLYATLAACLTGCIGGFTEESPAPRRG